MGGDDHISAGIALERTVDPREAYALLEMTGACVLRWDSTQKPAVIEAGVAALGRRLFVCWEPRTLRPHEQPGRRRRIVPSERTIFEATTPGDAGSEIRVEAQDVHVEGWGLGDAYPDVLAFLCQDEPSAGGESYLLDSYRLLAWLAAVPGERELYKALWRSPVALRTTPRRAPQVSALARRTRAGRVAVSYVPSAVTPVHDADGRPDHASRMADRWHTLVRTAAASAPRFALEPGDVLLIDNYRVYHGREGYAGRRVVHRGWFWSTSAFAYPMLTDRA